MKRLFASVMSLGLVAVMAIPSMAAVNAITPSTNDQNRSSGWAHFDVYEVGGGYAIVDLISTRSFYSCFEYRSDGDTSQKTSDSNYNPAITDGLYPYVCVNASTARRTISASDYVEIRMVFGAEGDERFDWTRVDVAADVSEKTNCKGDGWVAYGFENQGQCVRFLTSGKDTR